MDCVIFLKTFCKQYYSLLSAVPNKYFPDVVDISYQGVLKCLFDNDLN